MDEWFMAAYNYSKETKIKASKKDLVIEGLLHLGYEFNNEIHFLISANKILMKEESNISKLTCDREIKGVDIINKQLLPFL